MCLRSLLLRKVPGGRLKDLARAAFAFREVGVVTQVGQIGGTWAAADDFNMELEVLGKSVPKSSRDKRFPD